jgi:hypothetical protein
MPILVCFILNLVFIGTAVAGGSECSDLGLQQAYGPLSFSGGKVCFLYTKPDTAYEGDLSRAPDSISVYSIFETGAHQLIYELPYAGTPGKINDALFISVDGKSDEMLFVLHSFEKPTSWDPVSDIYGVSVVGFKEGNPVQEKTLSRFFDLGGDMINSQGKFFYTYPYKDRRSVIGIVDSPVFRVVTSPAPVRGVIKEKAFLYGGENEPTTQDPSKMYLVRGDKVAVKDSMAGWCKVNYKSKSNEIRMWVQCKSIVY